MILLFELSTKTHQKTLYFYDKHKPLIPSYLSFIFLNPIPSFPYILIKYKLYEHDTLWYCNNKLCAILYEIISNLLLNDSSLDSSLGWDEVSIDSVIEWVVEEPHS